MPGLRHIAARTLEERFPRADLAHGPVITGIIVPSGQRSRIREALRLAERFPRSRIVLTGFGPSELAALREKGFGDAILLDQAATNTYENARQVARLISPQPGERWLLVTSAIHMPRALGSFWTAGLHVEPWPVYDLPAHPEKAWPLIRHEWLGLASYRLRGRTTAFLPGPQHSSPAVVEAASRGILAR